MIQVNQSKLIREIAAIQRNGINDKYNINCMERYKTRRNINSRRYFAHIASNNEIDTLASACSSNEISNYGWGCNDPWNDWLYLSIHQATKMKQ